MKDALTILGLSEVQIKALAGVSQQRRQSALGLLRRYYGLLYHPDLTGKPQAMAEINSALDAISQDGGFQKAHAAHKPTGSDYDAILREQVRWLKANDAKKEGEFLEQLRGKVAIIKGLEEKNLKLERQVFIVEQKTSEAMAPKLQKVRDELKDSQRARTVLRTAIRRLIGRLISPKVPKGTIPLSEIDGLILKQGNSSFRIKERIMRRAGKPAGQLMGALAPEDEIKPAVYKPGNNDYDEVLSKLRFYFQEGMQPVAIKKNRLHVYSPVRKVE